MQAIKEIVEDGREVIENTKDVIEDRKEMIEDLFEKTEEYIKTNIQLYKLKATEKAAGIISSIAANILVILLGFFFLLMINLGIAYWLGTILGQVYYGFLIVAGFYALVTLIVFVFRKNIIQSPISNTIISQIIK